MLIQAVTLPHFSSLDDIPSRQVFTLHCLVFSRLSSPFYYPDSYSILDIFMTQLSVCKNFTLLLCRRLHHLNTICLLPVFALGFCQFYLLLHSVHLVGAKHCQGKHSQPKNQRNSKSLSLAPTTFCYYFSLLSYWLPTTTKLHFCHMGYHKKIF